MPGGGHAGPRALRFAYLVAVLFILGLLVVLAWNVLLPFVLAALITYLLAPLVDRGERAGLPRVLAILVAYMALAGVVLGATLYILPQAVRQATEVTGVLPELVRQAEMGWNHLLKAFHEAPMPLSMRRALTDSVRGGETLLTRNLRASVGMIIGLVPGLIAVVISPVLAFYLLKDLRRIQGRFWHLLPYSWHRVVYRLGRDLDRVLSGYVRGQLLVALLVGVLAGVYCAAIGVPFSLFIGVVVGLTDVVPYVGPIVGGLPAVLLALSHGFYSALWVVGGFALIHQLEGAVLAPKIIGDAVELHPLLVVLAILVGAETAGIPGMLAAVPVGASLNVLARHLYRLLVASRPRPKLHAPPSGP